MKDDASVMSMRDKLPAIKLRETSGSRASQGFSYQRDWSLCRLIELHSRNQDYAVLFDYIDDVVVLNSSTEPTQIDFYQIKKRRSGEIKLPTLLHRDKDAKGNPMLSIMGKLIGNYFIFQEKTRSLNLVSNLRYNLTLSDNGVSQDKLNISLKELSDDSISKLKLQMAAEHGVENIPDVDAITFFLVSELSPDDTATHVRGKLGDFLETFFPGKPIAVIPLYTALISEIERRGNKIADKTTFAGLLEQKGLSKKDIDQKISSLPKRVDLCAALERVCAQLVQDQMPYPEIECLKKYARRYECERTNKANTILVEATANIQRAKKNVEEAASYRTLREKIDLIAQDVGSTGSSTTTIITIEYLKGIALFWEFCND